MRPVLLKMTAFGSYADTTEVNFDRLTHNLYLITGDTGAGKTTIFDAIMFALYGTASGSDRKTEMLHCDFVDQSVDTEVILTFRERGKDYTVQRTIHYPKVRGAAGQYGDGKVDALLKEPGKDPLEGATKVTDRCTELIGLNRGQFRKIVMLAQGEFKEFLKANSDKKNEILGKLFDNSAYVRYQELLHGAREALRKERSGYVRRIEETMQSTFQPPEGLEGEARNRYLPENPELAENLNTLAGEEEQRLNELKQERETCRQRETELTTQKGAADGQNRLLDELAEKKKRLAALQAQSDSMKRLRADVDTVERVLHQIQPKRELLERAELTLRNTKKDIETLQKSLTAQNEVVEAAQKTVNADGAVQEEIQQLSLAIQTLEQTLPQYETLDGKRIEQQQTEQKAQDTKRRQAEVKNELDQENVELERIAKEQDALRDIDTQVLEKKTDYTEAQERTAALAGETGIAARVASLMQEEKQLAAQQTVLSNLAEEAARAETRHHTLYQAFIRGQAGVIARNLEADLTANGKAVCPVCHTEFSAGQAHSFALPSEETPAQAEVDQAKRVYEEKERKRAAQDKQVIGLQTSIRKEKESVLREAQRLLPACETWEALAAEGYLSQETARFRNQEAERKRAWEEAVQKQTYNNALAKQRSERESRRSELESSLVQLDKDLHECDLLARTLGEAIAELQRQLRYPDKAAALQQIQLQTGEKERLTEQLVQHQKALDQARQEQDTIRGNLSGKQDSLRGLEEARDAEERTLQLALSQNGFSTLEDANQVFLLLEGQEGEAWLNQQRDTIAKYDGELENTGKRVDELSEQLKDIAYTDVMALQQQIDQTAEAFNRANSACIKQEKLLENHRATAEKVTEAKQALNETEAAWTRLDQLATLAIGISGEGGKLSFDRYVMGAMFQEILGMANQRLNIMSGGRYELIHQVSAGRQNAKAGLEVEVLDMSTGKQRNSASLSGGESFLVSLSLALGLSDVVQNHAGGKRLDALFIDEGFGSLDSSTLDTALDVLNRLTKGNCLVGIISHVSKLEECIPQKIRVQSKEKGSTLIFE